MSIETENFTIIPGREFGLPCNLMCGPGVRPFGTIHFENRKNKTDEYDPTNELCITFRRNPNIIEGREKCIFSTDEIKMIFQFIEDSKDIIKKHLKGYTTSKGFLRDLHIARRKPLHDEVVTWKRLAFVQYGITLYVRYWPKDFTVEYKSKYGILKYYSLHIPAAFPRMYTQESIVKNCIDLWPDFLRAEKYIAERGDLTNFSLSKLSGEIVLLPGQTKL